MKIGSMKRKNSRIWALLAALILGMAAMGAQCPCDDDDDDDRGGLYLPTFSLNGGNGDMQTGSGGAGGTLNITASQPYSKVNITPTGDEFDSGLMIPGLGSPDLGPEPLVVSRDMVIDVYVEYAAADLNATDGEYMLFLDNCRLYRKDGAGDYATISGLRVNPGATLTLGLNYHFYGNDGQDQAKISFKFDVIINGTLRVKSIDTGDLNGGAVETRHGDPGTSADMGGLFIFTFGVIMVNGSIDLAGADATMADQRGGDGGAILLMSNDQIRVTGSVDSSGGDGMGNGEGGHASLQGDRQLGLLIETPAEVVNLGQIRAEGGDGAMGGDAFRIDMVSKYSNVSNRGLIFANGGNGRDGYGGDAATVTFDAAYGSVENRGRIEANGGAADIDTIPGPVVPGQAGSILINASQDILNRGVIEINGGDAWGAGDGTSGGSINMISSNYGTVYSNGTITLNGGDGAGAGHIGGSGGAFSISATQGQINIAGRVQLNGGDADHGGSGGNAIFAGGNVNLIGYHEISMRGGDGFSAGWGGNFTITSMLDVDVRTTIDADAGIAGNTPSDGGNISLDSTLGHLNFQGTLKARGSDSAEGPGGFGGTVSLSAALENRFSGNAFAHGGSGATIGGSAMMFNISGANVFTNGSIYMNGGDAPAGTVGGGGGSIGIVAYDHLTNRAWLYVDGGGADRATGTGGSGGGITLDSAVTPTDHFGFYDATGGDASVAGSDGNVTIDGVVVFP